MDSQQCGSALKESHCPLRGGAMREYTKGVPLPTAPKQHGSALQESHYLVFSSSVAVQQRSPMQFQSASKKMGDALQARKKF